MAENGNGKKNGHGKANGHALAVIDRKDAACRLFSQGKPIQEICAKLNVCQSTVYSYITAARLEIIGTSEDRFAQRAAVYVDDSFNALMVHTQLFADEHFIRTAEPERLHELKELADSLARNIALFMAAGLGRPRATG